MPHSSSSSKSELHVRLAALWGMPSELLFERQNQVAKLLAPAGCGTPAHALWVSSLAWNEALRYYGGSTSSKINE